MESLIIRGAGASGVYIAHPGTYLLVKNLIVDLPTSGNITNVTVTLSGTQTGAYTFNDSFEADVAFKPNEDVYITTTNFASNYGLILNYIQVGDGQCYMQTDPSRIEVWGYPRPWRFR